jgi:hypothetical protein
MLVALAGDLLLAPFLVTASLLIAWSVSSEDFCAWSPLTIVLHSSALICAWLALSAIFRGAFFLAPFPFLALINYISFHDRMKTTAIRCSLRQGICSSYLRALHVLCGEKCAVLCSQRTKILALQDVPAPILLPRSSFERLRSGTAYWQHHSDCGLSVVVKVTIRTRSG